MKQELLAQRKAPAKPLALKATNACCELCGRKFRARTKLLRFCDACRTESDEYRFADWLPLSA